MESEMINPNREIAKTLEEKALEEIQLEIQDQNDAEEAQGESLVEEDKESSDDWDEDFENDEDEESEDEEE